MDYYFLINNKGASKLLIQYVCYIHLNENAICDARYYRFSKINCTFNKKSS